MKIIKPAFVIPFVFAFLFSGCEKSDTSLPDFLKNPDPAKNIILMIGDGMGLATLDAASFVSPEPLNILGADAIGLQNTSSADNLITDSGAAGTALATGVKTKNGYIGIDPSGKSLRSIMEVAKSLGKSIGIVSTSAITHATPASFYAEEPDRNSYENIAYDFISSGMDVAIGGGRDNFSKRSDNRNLLDSLVRRNYTVYNSLAELNNVSVSGKVVCFTASMHNPYRLDGRGNMLPDATKKAIELLKKNEKGFVLMVEGSEIDWAGHSNSADILIDETLDFDNAAGVAINFTRADKSTLLIVTADHETGGVTIVDGDATTHTVTLDFSTKHHTAIMVPVYAFGKKAEIFDDVYENTVIYDKMVEVINPGN